MRPFRHPWKGADRSYRRDPENCLADQGRTQSGAKALCSISEGRNVGPSRHRTRLGKVRDNFIDTHGVAADTRGDILVADANTYWKSLFGTKAEPRAAFAAEIDAPELNRRAFLPNGCIRHGCGTENACLIGGIPA